MNKDPRTIPGDTIVVFKAALLGKLALQKYIFLKKITSNMFVLIKIM
jgi:hypothetical protein